MPLYEFEDDETGDRIELYMSVDAVPRNGEVVLHEGKRLRRVPTSFQGMIEPDFSHVTYTFSDEQCAKYGPRDRNGRPRKLDPAGGLPLTGKEQIEMQSRMQADGLTKGYDRGQFSKTKRKKAK